MAKEHRHAKGTASHVTADRSDEPARRRGQQKRIADGGTAPHLGTCKECGAGVIYHRSHGNPIVLDREDIGLDAVPPYYVILFGYALRIWNPVGTPQDVPRHREHVCKRTPPASSSRPPASSSSSRSAPSMPPRRAEQLELFGLGLGAQPRARPRRP